MTDTRPLSNLRYERIQETSTSPILIVLHDHNQNGSAYAELARSLAPRARIVGLESYKGVYVGREITGFTWYPGPIEQPPPIFFGDSLIEIEKFLLDQDFVEHTVTLGGFDFLAGGINSTNTSIMFARMKPWDERKASATQVIGQLSAAMQAVPRPQIETAEAYGMTPRQAFRRVLVPQMWVYALPGLSNLWMILIKATPLLFLLGVEDIVYWARELGGSKTSQFAYPHPDWRVFYFLGLLVYYLLMTKLSETVLGKLSRKLSRGQATFAGEQQRKAAA